MLIVHPARLPSGTPPDTQSPFNPFVVAQAEDVYWEQMRARQDRMDAFLASELGRSYATLIWHVVDELFCGWGRRR